MTSANGSRGLPPHLNLLAFVAGNMAAAAVYFGIHASHAYGFLALCMVWYAVAAGFRARVEPHPRQRAIYVALAPLTAGVAAAAVVLTFGTRVVAVLIALVAAPTVQWVLAHVFLRDVPRDKAAAMRRAAGVE
jgi:hypothetical protein